LNGYAALDKDTSVVAFLFFPYCHPSLTIQDKNFCKEKFFLALFGMNMVK